jgi:hypothetical protein
MLFWLRSTARGVFWLASGSIGLACATGGVGDLGDADIFAPDGPFALPQVGPSSEGGDSSRSEGGGGGAGAGDEAGQPSEEAQAPNNCPTICSGCCDMTGKCQAGTGDKTCGVSGAGCIDCTMMGGICSAATCVAGVSSGSSSGSGSGSGSSSGSGGGDDAGGACQLSTCGACPTLTMACCTTMGTCGCGALGVCVGT